MQMNFKPPLDCKFVVSFFRRNCIIVLRRHKNVFEVEDILDANGFEIPAETTAEVDASPKHQ